MSKPMPLKLAVTTARSAGMPLTAPVMTLCTCTSARFSAEFCMKLTKCSAVRSSGQGAVDTFRKGGKGGLANSCVMSGSMARMPRFLPSGLSRNSRRKVRRDLAAKQASDGVQRSAVQVEGKPCEGERPVSSPADHPRFASSLPESAHRDRRHDVGGGDGSGVGVAVEEGVAACADAYPVAAVNRMSTAIAIDQNRLHCIISAPQRLRLGMAHSIRCCCVVRRPGTSGRLSGSHFIVSLVVGDLSDR